MRSPQFILPASFDPLEFLRTPRLARLGEDAQYFVNLILRKTVRRRVDARGFVRLRAEYLRKVMSFRGYREVVDALLEGGAVERAPYAVGRQSFGYRLSGRYLTDRHVRIPITKQRILNAIAAFVAEQQDSQRLWLPVHYALAERQRRLRIDINQARRIIDGLPPESNPFDAQGIIAEDIRERRFHQHVGQYGRIANSISSMSRRVRPALRVNAQPLCSVDLCCAQLAIVAKLTRDDRTTLDHQRETTNRQPTTDSGKPGNQRATTTRARHAGQARDRTRGRTIRGGHATRPLYDVQFSSLVDSVQTGLGVPPDLSEFESLVAGGQLYDAIQADLRESGLELTRSQVKRKVLADVVAKKLANDRGAQYPSAVENAFRARFPTAHRFITRTNRGGWEHSNLIRILQRVEAALVIETIAADFMLRHPAAFIVTLHDAAFTTPGNLPKLERVFREKIEQTGFPVTFKAAGA